MTGVAASSVREAINSVFSGAAYRGATERSLLDDVIAWIGQMIAKTVHSVATTPGAASVVKWTVYALALLVATRLIYLGIQRYLARQSGVAGEKSIRVGENAWDVAESHARNGDYTAAAHALYAAVMGALVSRGVFRAHPSKTIGDYVRELRSATARGGSRSLLNDFTAFARTYEVVVYRDGSCDADRYTTLRELIVPLVRPRQIAA